MRYPASEKLQIIRTVEGSHLPVKQTLEMLGIPRTTFYRWYDLYVDGGLDGLADRSPRPGSVWNRIPDARRDDLIGFALEHEALTTRELAVKYTDEKQYFVSESSAYRILKAADLITAPDYVVIKAADEFTDKTTAINEMWQTDFTYFKIIGWGWYYRIDIFFNACLVFMALTLRFCSERWDNTSSYRITCIQKYYSNSSAGFSSSTSSLRLCSITAFSSNFRPVLIACRTAVSNLFISLNLDKS